MTAQILVTRKLPPSIEDALSQSFVARLNADDSALSPEELVARSADADGLLVCHLDRVGAEVIEALPSRCRIITTYSTGTEHIDLAAASARGIVVANAPGGATQATAEIAILLMLAAARRAHEGDTMIRNGAWDRWAPLGTLGIGLDGRTLGLVGMGRIGRAVAVVAEALGMKIRFLGSGQSSDGDPRRCASLKELFSSADVISFHCPSSPLTRHLLNHESVQWLRDGAIVVNTARGNVVLDEALIGALKSGKVAAAGLDVFENEPDLNPEYRTLKNTFLLPHWGGATMQTRVRLGQACVDNLVAFFAGEPVPGKVN